MQKDIKVEEGNSGTLVPETASTTGTSTPLPVDLEKSSSQNLSTSNPNEDSEFKRPLSGLSWSFVCIGLCLGALLYGMLMACSFCIQANNC